jgi:hypothetical protein
VARPKFKDSKYKEPFVGIVRSVFDSAAYLKLSPHACKLLLDVAGQYRGDNNGDLTAAWSVMSKRGWRSRTTLWRCKDQLIELGFVYVTRAGRMPNTCELLALTWFPLDVSKKFDAGALAGFVARAYMAGNPLVMPTIKPKPDWTLPGGGMSQPEKCSA